MSFFVGLRKRVCLGALLVACVVPAAFGAKPSMEELFWQRSWGAIDQRVAQEGSYLSLSEHEMAIQNNIISIHFISPYRLSAA